MKRDKLFDFVVRSLGFLKHVPLLPHLFDSLLRLRTFVYKRELLDVFDRIEDEVMRWKGTSIAIHKYGGLQFNVHDKEIGHLHANGLLDILYSRKIKMMLINERNVSHHLFEKSGWISFYLTSPNDEAYALKLLTLSYAAKVISVSSQD